MSKPDLNRLKAEIASRKNEKTASFNGVAPRDAFLNGLLESLQTGRETVSTALVKTVDNTVAERKGESKKFQVNETVEPTQSRPVQRPVQTEQMDMSPERDEQLWMDIERRKKQTLSESMQQYMSAPSVGTPMNNTIQQKSIALNETYLTENVKKIVDNYLIDNFGPVVEEAIKSTILEMYAVERIKEVLNENKEMIKSLVYETIREIQVKAKQKNAQK